jgi:hypothetical protein
MRISAIAVVMALVLSPLAMAQSDKPSDSAAPAAPAAAPAPTQSASAPSTQEGTALKSAISTPGCYVKFLEAKIAGKLSGKKWSEYRRDVCGAHEITAVFPTAIAPKYASEKDLDKALTKTCADQFTANKASNANGGLKWVEKDGGYYAECINRLKDG